MYRAGVPASLPLDALDTVDWPSLTHAYGTAEQVPEALRALAVADAASAAAICADLAASLDHQGVQRFEATLRAVPFLVGLVGDATVPGRDHIARLLADFAVGDTNWFLHNGFHPDEATFDDGCSRPGSVAEGQIGDTVRRAFPSIGVEPGTGHDMTPGGGLREIYEAVRDGVPVYLDALRTADDDTRAAVAYLLAWLTPSAGDLVGPLALVLESDPVPRVRASAALGLSHASKFEPDSRAYAATALHAAWQRGGTDLERRCVALALVRFEDAQISEPVRAPLADWLAAGVPAVLPADRFPWIRIDSAPFLFCTLFLGSPEDERANAVRAACAGLPAVADHHDAADLAVWLVRLCVPFPDSGAPHEDLREVALAAIEAAPRSRYYADVGDALAAR
jgi:hypothetical protein